MIDIPGFENLYAATTDGRIYSHKSRIFLKFGKSSRDGRYFVVCLYRDGKQHMRYVHRLVAVTFLGDKSNHEVNHIDFDTTNNSLSNLEWVTPSGNIAHAVSGGRGVGQSKVKRRTLKQLSDAEIRFIKEQYGTMSLYRLAKLYGVNPITIRSVI